MRRREPSRRASRRIRTIGSYLICESRWKRNGGSRSRGRISSKGSGKSRSRSIARSSAKRTIATIGPDTDVTQLLNSAQVEIEARERKRDQEKTIESIRELVQAGQFDEAARSLRSEERRV